MTSSLLKPHYFLDDQDLFLSQSLINFASLAFPLSPLFSPLKNPLNNKPKKKDKTSLSKHLYSLLNEPKAFVHEAKPLTRSHSQTTLDPIILFHPRKLFSLLRSMRKQALVHWFRDIRTLRALESSSLEKLIYEELAELLACFIENNALNVTQKSLVLLLSEVKELQASLNKSLTKNVQLGKLLNDILYELKQMGRLIYYFGFVYEENSPNSNKNQLKRQYSRNKRSKKEIIEKINKYCGWKLDRWKQDFNQKKEEEVQLSAILIICKICLRKVPSNYMNFHSDKCMKRAETLHEVHILNKSIPKYLAMASDVKQFLITQTKLVIKTLKSDIRPERHNSLFRCSTLILETNPLNNLKPNFKGLTSSLQKPSSALLNISKADSFMEPKLLSSNDFPQKTQVGGYESEEEQKIQTISHRKDLFLPIKVSEFAKKDSRSRGETLYNSNDKEFLRETSLKSSNQDRGLFNRMIKRKLMKELDQKPWLQDFSPQLSSIGHTSQSPQKEIFENVLNTCSKENNKEGSYIDYFSEAPSEKSNKISPVDKAENNFDILSLDLAESINESFYSKPSPIKTDVENFQRKINKVKTHIITGVNSSTSFFKENSSMRQSSKFEKRALIRKDDEGIKKCNEIENKLKEISESEFSKSSVRNIKKVLQYLKEVKELFEEENFTNRQSYVYKELLEVIEFVERFLKQGELFLKYKLQAQKHIVIDSRNSSNEGIRARKRVKSIKLKKQNSLSLQRKTKSITKCFQQPLKLISDEIIPERNSFCNERGEIKSALMSKIQFQENTPITSFQPEETPQKNDPEENNPSSILKIDLIPSNPRDHEILMNKGLVSPGVFRHIGQTGMKKSFVLKKLEFGQYFFNQEEKPSKNTKTKEILHSPIYKYTKRKSVEVLSPARKSSPTRRRMNRNSALLPLGAYPIYPIFDNSKRRSCFIPQKDWFTKRKGDSPEKDLPTKERKSFRIALSNGSSPMGRDPGLHYEDKKEECIEEEDILKRVCFNKNVPLRDSQKDLIEEGNSEEEDEEEEEEEEEESLSELDVKDYMRDYYSDSDVINLGKSIADIEIKEEIGMKDFEFLSLIGRGAYGRVYLVKRKGTEDLYAMKIINTMDNMNKNKLVSLQTESKIFDLVTSDFVVKALFKFRHEVFFCFAMEYMHGGDFSKLLQTYGRFDEPIARFYIAELLLAIEHLHDVGVVHRDLKPDNILLDCKGHIKLTDFGLSDIAIATLTMNKRTSVLTREAKFHSLAEKFGLSETILENNAIYRFPKELNRQSTPIGDNSPPLRHRSLKKLVKNQGQRIIGTPDYIAQEILNGVVGSLNSPAVDIWSLGVILFEFLTGIPPFSDETVDKIFDNIINLRVPWDEITNEGEEVHEGEEKLSKEAISLLKGLLVEQKERLTAEEIKKHPFFEGVDWEHLHQSIPPIVPEKFTEIEKKALGEGFNKRKSDLAFLETQGMIGANLKEDPEELRQNVRFDLLHLENKKIALETIRKLKGSTVESPNIDMMAINHNTEPYAFDYALSPNPKSFKKRKEDDTINRIYLFKNESLLN